MCTMEMLDVIVPCWDLFIDSAQFKSRSHIFYPLVGSAYFLKYPLGNYIDIWTLPLVILGVPFETEYGPFV